MSKFDTDVLIAGAGLSGLSLAIWLRQLGYGGRITLCDPRPRYDRDRTWCLWNCSPHPFASCISHAWSSWRVSIPGAQVVRRSRRYQYVHIPADRLYGFARAKLSDTHCRVEPAAVLSVTDTEVEGQPGVRAETNAGSIVSRYCFDSRPAWREPARPTAGFLQRFLGWHVEVDAPVFDCSTVGLMDFYEPQGERIHFSYLLPFSTTEALVEETWFDPVGVPAQDAAPLLAAAVGRMTHRRPYRILYREQGCLPMSPAAQESQLSERHMRIGIAGGRAKPSSGYAFARIQRQSRAIAERLVHGGPLPERFEPRRFAMLDEVFLTMATQVPSNVPHQLLRMFENAPSDSLVRFLSEQSSWAETMRVAACLPWVPATKAAFATLARAA